MESTQLSWKQRAILAEAELAELKSKIQDAPILQIASYSISNDYSSAIYTLSGNAWGREMGAPPVYRGSEVALTGRLTKHLKFNKSMAWTLIPAWEENADDCS